ncbi:hypothetical protein THAOC_22159 [Thalassiosira oceanica]|uniref:Uncharacterized protein n=1 Tax=Thalassiosira oceanica TaxID=159749 RepID=K0SGV9_THAOC|nr:hypothetical protein THAOC_22159 [Thalassiosira oceanica]|eukprot:EJK57762.1 hypothetical protein THAOC_22159 [Thalassiosira oceanica]
MEENTKSEKTISCKGCRMTFVSKNKLFKHLRQDGAACLSSDEYATFQRSDERNWQRIAVLYGYIPGDDFMREDSITDPKGIAGGDHAAWVVTQALDRISRGSSHIGKQNWARRDEESKVIRSYGSVTRGGRGATFQDAHTGAITEVLCTNALVNCASDASTEERRESDRQWAESVNDMLDKILDSMSSVGSPGRLRVFGRVTISKRFNAETDLDRRRVDYVMPVDMLFTENKRKTLQGFCDSFNSFGPGATQETRIQEPDATTLDYLLRLKRLMMKFTSQADFVSSEDKGAVIEQESNEFGVLAHEFMAYRRVDRMFHRATIRSSGDTAETSVVSRRPFIVLSCSGDFFLRHQVARMLGLLIAICRGLIGEDILEAMFDEKYSGLMLAPAAPHRGLLAGEAGYTLFEGKAKAILSARRCEVYDRGFNDDIIVSAVERWQVCEAMGSVARTSTGAVQTMEIFKREKINKLSSVALGGPTLRTSTLQGSPESSKIDRREWSLADHDPLEVRFHADILLFVLTASCRQLVMLSTTADTKRVTSLAVLGKKAKKNDKNSSRSPYSYVEGEGGASGSFSVGFMPGNRAQPKHNQAFPALTRAAFELERALYPNRPPSSTIAVNRNAQFRHKGAGSGQSTSLIVALGDYTGGQLMVEGEENDILYQPLEFDGWTQRHWTLPFAGERYSLVWFTPLGCEGRYGLDLH